jgi:hypothetical protein
MFDRLPAGKRFRASMGTEQICGFREVAELEK